MREQLERQDYKAFVLRLWRDASAQSAWRCSLEDPATHQRRGFEDVDALASYLRAPSEPGPTNGVDALTTPAVGGPTRNADSGATRRGVAPATSRRRR